MSRHKFEDIAVRHHAVGMRSTADLFGELSLEQLAKVEDIVEILDALPPVSVDDELDAVLIALQEVRDRDG